MQPDIFLNGVPYVQMVSDVTTPGNVTPIHFEPGIWLSVPPTSDPAVALPSLVRMASIPHGTTILCNGILKCSGSSVDYSVGGHHAFQCRRENTVPKSDREQSNDPADSTDAACTGHNTDTSRLAGNVDRSELDSAKCDQRADDHQHDHDYDRRPIRPAPWSAEERKTSRFSLERPIRMPTPSR